MNLERELRAALRRQHPPDGFDERLRARSDAGGPASVPLRRALGLPIAASLMLTIGASYYVQQRQQQQAEYHRAAAERTARDVALALQVTSKALDDIRTRVQEIARHDR